MNTAFIEFLYVDLSMYPSCNMRVPFQ